MKFPDLRVLALWLALGAGAAKAQETSTYLYDVHGRLVSNGTAAATANSRLSLYGYDTADNRNVRHSTSYTPRSNIALLLPNESLIRGQAAVSDDAQSRMEFQHNGSVVITCNGVVQVTLYVANGQAALLSMQGDGNLVLYDAALAPLWASGTSGYPGSYFVIQGDGNAVIYQGGTPLWYTSTSC